MWQKKWEGFAYNYVNEISMVESKKKKKTKKPPKRPKDAKSFRTGTETEQAAGGSGGGRGQVLQSGWHGGWLVSAWLATHASDGLALQGHHHVPTQFLSQGPPILDVVQPVYLPLVLDS